MATSYGKNRQDTIVARKDVGELPDHLCQMVRGYMPSRCILSALKLDVFTAIGKAIGKGATSAQLAAKIDTNGRQRKSCSMRSSPSACLRSMASSTEIPVSRFWTGWSGTSRLTVGICERFVQDLAVGLPSS